MIRLAQLVAPASLVAFGLLSLTGCDGGSTDTTRGPTATAESDGTATPGPSNQTSQAEDLQLALGTSELSVGENRLTFALIDAETGPVRDARVEVSTFRLTARGTEGPIETVEGVFRKWPVVPSGVYTAQISFDQPGAWGIGVIATLPDGATRPGSVQVQVTETSMTPAIGAAAPRSRSKTVSDVSGLEELTSDRRPDPTLYEMTIADAVEMGNPVLVLFATPAYCETATCGPQIEVVKELKDQFEDRMSFIHVEIYDNPHEIEGELDRAVVSPTVKEWNLSSEPWTFIIDRQGLIHSKFEAFTTQGELEPAILEVLK